MDIRRKLLDLMLGRQEREKDTTEDVVRENFIPFDLSCCEVSGKWGIFVRLNRCMLMIDNPDDLIVSVYKDEEIWLRFRDERDSFKVIMRVDSYVDATIYRWRIHSLNLRGVYVEYAFEMADYQRSVKNAVTHYLEACKAGETMDCWDERDLQNLTLGLQQMDVTCTLPTAGGLEIQDVQTEKFTFEPLEDVYYSDYRIGMGDRCYDIWIDHDFVDFDTVRHELECIVYNEEAQVRLPSECFEDTIITFKKESVLKSIKPSGAYDYSYLMRVEIEAEACEKPSFLAGYCERKQAVRVLYEGLLKFALLHPKEILSTQPRIYDEDVPTRINLYNIFKSLILEDYIVGKSRNDNAPQTRQRMIREVVIVCPGRDTLGYEAISEKPVLVDAQVNEVEIDCFTHILQGVADWMNDYHDMQSALEAGEEAASSFNWKQFHERGMALAGELRKQLPADIDVWYKSPAEDKTSAINALVI